MNFSVKIFIKRNVKRGNQALNNPVAKHDFNKGGAHKDKKRASTESQRKQKHKGKEHD